MVMERKGYVSSTPKPSLTWEFIDSFLTWHYEPAECAIHVGWIGYVGLLMKAALIGYMVYQLAVTNFYLENIVPNGQIAHWAASGSLAAIAATQLSDNSSTGLCTYQKRFDYLYGADNKWNYRANTCTFASVDELAFKHPSALHFVSYVQQRKLVVLPKVGGACDDECQAVYPNWPTSAEYDRDGVSFKSVHVKTEEDVAARKAHPTLPEVPNVHMQKPSARGPDKCECWSLKNTFNLGVDGSELHFNHRYDSDPLSGSSSEASESSPTTFYLAYENAKRAKATKPFKHVEPGEGNGVGVEEVLKALGTCLDCQPVGPFFENALCVDGTCPSGIHPKPALRLSGAIVDVQVEYYNSKLTMPKGEGNEAYEYIKESFEPPYAVVLFRLSDDWTSRGSSVTIIEDQPAKKVMLDNYRYGVLFKLRPATGVISKFSFYVMLDYMVNMTVLLSYPGFVMGLLVFFGLGRRSELYMKAKRKYNTVSNMYRSYACSAIMAHRVFDQIDQDGDGFLGEDEVMKEFEKVLLPKLMAQYPDKGIAWCREALRCFMNRVMNDTYHPEDENGKPIKTEKARGISHKDFIANCTFSESFDWDDMMLKVENLRSDKGPVEQVNSLFRRSVIEVSKDDRARVQPLEC